MSIIGKLLGGFQKQKVGVKQAPTLTKTQRQLLDKMTNLLLEQVGVGVPSYPRQIVPGPSTLQTQAFQTISDILGGQGIGGEMLGRGMEALSDILKPYDPTLAMQAWEKSVKEPVLRTWREELLPEISERFGAQNALSSSALRQALIKSGERLGSDISGQLAQTLLTERQQARQAQLAGIPLTQLPLQQVMQALQAGGIQREIEAQMMQEPYQKWLYEQPYMNPWLTNYLSLVLGVKPWENIAYTKSAWGLGGGLGFNTGGSSQTGGWGNLNLGFGIT